MDSETQLQAYARAEALAGIGHWYIDIPSETLFWSHQVYLIHGLDPDRYTPTQESAINFYHPDDRPRVQDYVTQSIVLGQNFEFSLRLIRHSGDVCYVNSRAECEKDEHGHVVRVFGVLQDVTDSEPEHAILDRTRSAHKTLIESTNDGYWDWYIQEDYQYMSPAFWEMFGYQPEEKPHSPSAWQDMIFKDDLDVASANFQKHIDTQGEHPYRQEVRYRHKDGSTVTVLCRGHVIEWDRENKPLRMIGTHTDISLLKQVEQELRNMLDFHQLLINANTDLVFAKDAEYKIIEANEAFLSLYPEKTRTDIIGTTTVEAYKPDEAEVFLAEDKKAFETGLSETTETILFPDGKKRTFLTKKMRFNDRQGRPHILCVARNITQLRNTELALIKANEELKEFAYRTSHDLRSPLVSSRRLLAIVLKRLSKGETAQAQQNLTMIDGSLGKLETLITDILCMTRLGHEEADIQAIDVERLVDDSLQKLAHMEGFSRVLFTLDFSQLDALLETSLNHLTHVLENLLSNAIKYQDFKCDHACVTISAEYHHGQVVLSVSDNGIGIPEAQHEQIFTMFKRFHPKTAFGSGLGLYMVKKNVERMQGSITYTPLDKGSQFNICIPLSPQIKAST